MRISDWSSDVCSSDLILDEGLTLVAIRDALEQFRPASLKVAVLVEKRHDRRAPRAHAEFIGLAVEDRYVFGCGMDYKEYWRQRSEEHTSELQSLMRSSYAVFCLQKQNRKIITHTTNLRTLSQQKNKA